MYRVLRLLVAASLMVVLVVSTASSKTSRYSKGCNSHACEVRVCKSSCHARLAQKAIRARAAGVSALARCIARVESTNNPQAANGIHTGLGQWSPEAWQRHGGLRFASTPRGATFDQQLIVIEQGLAKYGCRDWCPFDAAPEAC